MPKLPSVSGQEIIRALERLGFVVASQRGSHVKLRRDGKICVVPAHKEVKKRDAGRHIAPGRNFRCRIVESVGSVNLSNYIKSSFTPFEMAVANRILTALCIVTVTIFMGNAVPRWAIMLVLADYAILSVGCWYFSRCPNCSKPADTEYFFSEQSRWSYLERKFYFGLWNRIWPDRECSECRYQLDQVPEQYGD